MVSVAEGCVVVRFGSCNIFSTWGLAVSPPEASRALGLGFLDELLSNAPFGDDIV